MTMVLGEVLVCCLSTGKKNRYNTSCGAMLRSLFYLLQLQEIYCFEHVRLTSYQYHPDRRWKNIVVGFGTGWRLPVSYWLLVSGNGVWGK